MAQVTPSATPASAPTAGATSAPTLPSAVREHMEKAFQGDINSISTQRNFNAISAQADHGLTPAGAQAFSRGQQPAFLVDQTRMQGKQLLAHELTHVVQQ